MEGFANPPFEREILIKAGFPDNSSLFRLEEKRFLPEITCGPAAAFSPEDVGDHLDERLDCCGPASKTDPESIEVVSSPDVELLRVASRLSVERALVDAFQLLDRGLKRFAISVLELDLLQVVATQDESSLLVEPDEELAFLAGANLVAEKLFQRLRVGARFLRDTLSPIGHPRAHPRVELGEPGRSLPCRLPRLEPKVVLRDRFQKGPRVLPGVLSVVDVEPDGDVPERLHEHRK